MDGEQIGSATLYCGDCLEVMCDLDPSSVSLVLTDPPYGVAGRPNYRERKRTALALCNNFAPIVGDDRPFDPIHLLRFRRLILFGANHYAHRLPPSPAWIIWDKLAGLTSKRVLGFNDQADVEMAWTNLGGPARLIPHRWMGCMKGSEHTQRRVHPTQKPVALMRAIIEHYTQPGDLVVDPYMGSGSTIVAAIEAGRRAIGMEIDAGYFDIACARIRSVVAAPRQPDLYDADTAV